MKKKNVGILGIIGIVVLVVALSGCVSDDNNTTTTPTSAPQSVSIVQLYNNAVPVGTYVTVTGKALEGDGQDLRVTDTNGKDIMVTGDDVSAYEGNQVTVTGYFNGAGSYDTAMGSTRTIPYVINAKLG